MLVECRTELPLLVQRPLRGPGGEAVVVLLQPAGALFDGDAITLSISCEAGVDVTLVGSSATRLNRCDTLLIDVRIEADISRSARFRYLPLELIPFRGARLRQTIDLRLDGDAEATLLEVVSPGSTTEPFTYTQLDFETRASVDDVPSMRERFTLTSAAQAALAPYSHYGSALVIGGSVDAERATRAHERLVVPNVAGSASALPAHGVVVKALGSSAQALRAALLDATACPVWLSALMPS